MCPQQDRSALKPYNGRERALFFATLLNNTPISVGDRWGTPNPALTDPDLDNVSHARCG
jgi:hypothetical protein